jgi:hypothetical protein
MWRSDRIRTLWGPGRSDRRRRSPGLRFSALGLDELEHRITPSAGGGWISSTQAGQSGVGLLGQYYDNEAMS